MAADLFKGQDYRLTLITGIDLTGATLLRILYTTPTSKKGSWSAIQDVQNIYKDVTSVENNEAGVWQFQSYVEISGKKYYGEIVRREIFKNLA